MKKLFPNLLFLFLCIGFLWPNTPLSAQSKNSSEIEEEQLKGLKYRMVGPYRGGRSTAVAGYPDNPFTFLMGGTGGGCLENYGCWYQLEKYQ